MPVPSSVTTRVVQGTFIDALGVPQTGTIAFRLDQELIATVEAWGIIPSPTLVTLDSSGHFSIQLMTSNDSNLFPSGFRYIVQERFTSGYLRTYSIDLPYDTAPLDLPTASQYDPGGVGLTVVSAINGKTGIVVLVPGDIGAVALSSKGAINGVASLDGTGKIPIAQLPALASGVDAVDGRTGVVTLTDLYATLGHTHSYPVTSVNSKTGAVSLAASDVGAVSASLLGAINGVATLDSSGKLLGSQVPSSALVFVYDVSSQAAMLALSATQGDMARRTDQNQTYVLSANDPSVLANWKLIITPPSAVSSVNGFTGTVVLTANQVGAVATSQVGAALGVASLDVSSLVPVAQIPGLDASKIITGLINFNRLPTGSSSTTVAVGNHTHAYIPLASIGAVSGVAALDGAGKVPTGQLPTYVISVNGGSGAVTLAASDVGAIAQSARGTANGVASLDASTLVPVAQIPSLDAAKVGTGVLDIARIPTGTTVSTVSLGNHTHTYVPLASVGAINGVAALDGTALVPIAQLPTGTSASTVALGNHTHTYVPLSSVGAASGVASLDGSALVPTAQIPGLDASKIITGSVAIGLIPTGTTGTTVALGNDARITGALQAASNLADLGNVSTARTNLGLGAAALLPVGTTTGTVAAGDDSRLTGARTPTAHASTHASVGSDPVSPASIGAVDLSDTRLTDARTPTAHATTHAFGGSDPVTPAAIKAVPLAGGNSTGVMTGALNINATGNLTTLSTLPLGYGDAVSTGVQMIGSFIGGENTSDSTARVNFYAYQRCEGNPTTNAGSYGEVMRTFLMRLNARAPMAWYGPTLGFDTGTLSPASSTSWAPKAWVGAHFTSNSDPTQFLNRLAFSVPDSTGVMVDRLVIPFGLQGTSVDQTVKGLDTTVMATKAAHFVVDGSGGRLGVAAAPGTARVLEFNSDAATSFATSKTRWKVQATSTAESGTNAGSDFSIAAYSDTGTLLSTPIAITRSSGAVQVSTSFQHSGSSLGFYGATTVSKPTVTGSKGGNAALTSLLTALANLGLLTDSST